MIGEWLFSLEAFGDEAPDPDSTILWDLAGEISYLGGSQEELRDRLLRTRHEDVPAYLDCLVRDVPWNAVRVVGFTVTFQQSVASFALAHRLKARFPEIVTVFGGASFDGEMASELVRSVDCIDYAVSGEGDIAFPRLLSAIAAGKDIDDVPGIIRRDGRGIVAGSLAPPLQRLDDLPVPDYGEYFDRAERLGLLGRDAHRNVWIPFEGARGCWWGEKHHCTFCGLNGTTMKFRSKSPGRVFHELALQARRYRSFHFEAVDNIADSDHLKHLLPLLIDSNTDYEMFYEVKANLTRMQIKLMAQAGVTRIQPGLESLNSNVLRLMRKGVRAAQNINVLRWAQYYGIDVAWNILWGFPGEVEEDYANQASVIPHLTHLQPPSGAARIWLERFSPLFREPDSPEVRYRTAERSYQYVYPRRVDLDSIAYFFDYEFVDALPEDAYKALSREVAKWSEVWNSAHRPVLTYWSAPHFIQIYDDRRKGHEGTYTFRGALADIYVACSDRPTTAAALRHKLHLEMSTEAIQDVLDEFHRRGLMFLDGSLALALALPAVRGR